MTAMSLPYSRLWPEDDSTVQIGPVPISHDSAVAGAASADIGAVVTFTGIVRADQGVQSLLVEAYPEAAAEELERIVQEAALLFGASVDVIHRTGKLAAGEAIVLITSAAAHRREAFLACEYTIEELKRRAPLWKKEMGSFGDRWVGK
ncbi:MAG: molybdopterin guanine dinucleotide biosynthesis protein MoaE [Methanosaeta sp. PtaB.Bin039]|nr:MAG: molybdopterin guanine dinucleotide biosynthesis protein MoaE [Methanosaeta sp. PtaB.Bin039]HOT07685.1 molybdenum cofactor biosynthesis protein MoaE [Methanotrichaceae archaeon]